MDPMGDGLKFLAQFILCRLSFDLQPMLIDLPRGRMSHIREAWSNRSMDDSEKDRKGRRLQNGSGSQENKVQIFSGVFVTMGFRKNP